MLVYVGWEKEAQPVQESVAVVAVRAEELSVDVGDDLHGLGNQRGTRCWGVSGRSDLQPELGQHGTDRLDSEPLLVFRDEIYEFGSRGSSSLAKKADAAFKISFARRSS